MHASIEPAAKPEQYLTFTIGQDAYALPVLRVREIIEYDVVTRVPRMPAWIRGVINLRGCVVPVVDLALKFSGSASAVSRRTCIVIVETELDGRQAAMGVIADNVDQVVDLLPADVQAPPAFGTGLRADYLLGIARLARTFVLLLDIDAVLSAEELLLAAHVAAAQAEPEGADRRETDVVEPRGADGAEAPWPARGAGA